MGELSIRRTRPRVGAFFDMDKTLIAENSGSLYVKYRYERGEIGALEVLAHELVGLRVDGLDHHLTHPGDGLLLEFALTQPLELDHHVLRPAADVENPHLVLQVGAQALEQVHVADLAAVVAVLHVERGRVLRDQSLVHVEERPDPGPMSRDFRQRHGESVPLGAGGRFV